MTGPLTVVLALGCLAFALWAAFLLYRDRPVGRRTVAAAGVLDDVRVDRGALAEQGEPELVRRGDRLGQRVLVVGELADHVDDLVDVVRLGPPDVSVSHGGDPTALGCRGRRRAPPRPCAER